MRNELEEIRVGRFHLFGSFVSFADLNQFALADAGAPFGGFLPLLAGFPEMRPPWEEAALCGFGGVDAAAGFGEEAALATARFAKAALMAGAVDVELFELLGCLVQELGGFDEIFFGEIDEALHVTAFGTAGLAGEAEGIGCGWRHGCESAPNGRACKGW